MKIKITVTQCIRKVQNDYKGVLVPKYKYWTTEPKGKIVVTGFMVMVNGTVADEEFLSVRILYKQIWNEIDFIKLILVKITFQET